MKKYLSLLIVFLMVFVLGNQMAQAKDGEDDSSDDIKIETSANVEIETSDEDNDDDNDGVLDIKDLKELDHDNDGLPDDEDNDDDEDGILDVGDLKLFDHDNDGLDDSKDKDDDNDKILDINDSKPFDRDNDGQHDDANKETQTKREEIKKQIPELSLEKISRFKKQYNLQTEDAETLSAEKELAELFEQVAAEIDPILAAKWLRRDLMKVLHYNKKELKEVQIDAKHIIELLRLVKEKINALIAKFELKGVVTVDAKAFVATAEIKLNDAKKKIVEINVLLAASINELTLENKTKLRTLAQETQTLIIEAHSALKEAVKSLKTEIKIKMEADANIE